MGMFKELFGPSKDEVWRRLSEEIERLKALYELFARVLNHLCQIGSAYEDDPQVELK